MTERLFILSPAVVLAARVNMPSVTYPVSSIAFDGITSGLGVNARDGQTVFLGSAPGKDDYGRQRVRQGALNTIVVAPTNQGTNDSELTIVDNAYLTVLDEYRVWTKMPRIATDGTMYKDTNVASTSGATTPPPIANGGAGYAGTVNPSTGLSTVNFSSSGSLQWDLAITYDYLSAPTSVVWDVKDGTITSGTTTSTNITVTFPPGFRWVSLMVHSANTSKNTFRYIPVFTRNPADDDSISNFHVSSQVHRADGQELMVQLFDELPRTTYPEGSLVMFWDDDLESASVDRTHMRFIGWMHREDFAHNAADTMTQKATAIRCVDVAGKLKEIPGFSQMLVYQPSSVLKWTETKYNRVFYYLWYILNWHTTALNVADLRLTSLTLGHFEFARFSSDEGNVWEQATTAASRVIPDQHLTVNCRGQLSVVVDPILQNVADRSATVVQTLDANDWTSIQFSKNRMPKVRQILAWAIENDGAGVGTLRSVAPEHTNHLGLQYIETSEHIVDNQFDLDNVTGNRFARLNSPFGKFSITLPYEKLDPAVDPATMQWVSLAPTGDVALDRTNPFPTTSRGIVEEISVTRDYTETGLIRTTNITWEKETSGQPGVVVWEVT